MGYVYWTGCVKCGKNVHMVFDEQSLRSALGKRLQEYRQEKGFTLDNVVEAAGLDISRSSLSAIENGNQGISAWELYGLSKIYGFSLDALMDKINQDLLSEKYSIKF